MPGRFQARGYGGHFGAPMLSYLPPRHPECAEDVEPYHRPAKSPEVVVDLVHEPAITPAAIRRAGPFAAAPLGPPAIEDDLDRGIARKRSLGVLEELLPIARDDQDLLGGLPRGLVATLRVGRPALRERMELGQDLQRPLVEELGEEHPGISATRGARRDSDFKACLAIEAQRQAAKRHMQR